MHERRLDARDLLEDALEAGLGEQVQRRVADASRSPRDLIWMLDSSPSCRAPGRSLVPCSPRLQQQRRLADARARRRAAPAIRARRRRRATAIEFAMPVAAASVSISISGTARRASPATAYGCAAGRGAAFLARAPRRASSSAAVGAAAEPLRDCVPHS
jgi:hypothetical protein